MTPQRVKGRRYTTLLRLKYEAQRDRDEQLGNSSSVAEEVSIDIPLTSQDIIAGRYRCSRAWSPGDPHH